jgi:diphosphate-dependent phosphofructokinase
MKGGAGWGGLPPAFGADTCAWSIIIAGGGEGRRDGLEGGFMIEKSKACAEDFLNHPEVREVLSTTSRELLERRAFNPPRCKAFQGECTSLRDTGRYVFDVDPQAAAQLPSIIGNRVQEVVREDEPDERGKALFSRPRNIGIVFSGGPAPGGHNVIAGLYDAAKAANPKSRVYGFLMGPDGIIENEAREITREMVDAYRNLGGFTMIKTGRTKIDTREKMDCSLETCRCLGLDALVIVGGDDSNTNAAFLAQELYGQGIQVIGVPKTIDGDIQVRDARGNVLCPMSFGFHTAARAFSNNIANLCTDSSSDVKYWHICKVMGRVASHLALEVALQTHATVTLIGEDLCNYVDEERLKRARLKGITDYSAYGLTMRHLSRVICKAIVKRAAAGKNYGVIVIPEGVLEFINEIQTFIIKLSRIIAEHNEIYDRDFHSRHPTLPDKLEYLKKLARRCREENLIPVWSDHDDELFNDLPDFFQEGLLSERDSHGNFQFSLVETDKVVMGMVRDYLGWLRVRGEYIMGIDPDYYRKVLEKDGLDPVYFGPALFSNWGGEDFLLVKKDIISRKTLQQELLRAGVIGEKEAVPRAVEKIFNASVPKFKTQNHFYGYDGRGNDPTRFDCTYTYNLGLCVFSLIAHGATGQMAAIRNLELDFSQWEPIGIPIAPLMRLEERKGKLSLVLEKSVVDVESPSFRVAEAMRDKWLAAHPGPDEFRRPGPIRFSGSTEEDRPITLVLNSVEREKEESGA